MNDKIETVDVMRKTYNNIKQERDELRVMVRKLQDIKQKHEHEELVAAQENDRLKIELDEAREALKKINHIYINGGDTYLDFVKVGNIAREFLERDKMKTLQEFNDNALKHHIDSITYPKPNGIECPECKKELMDSDCMVLCSFPAQKNVECECGYRGYRFC